MHWMVRKQHGSSSKAACGTITPYGVVYDNGMKLEQIYDGRFFPCYYYEPNAITVAVTSKAEPEDTEHITWLFLPMVQEEIDRALLRGGITDSADVRLRLEDSQLPNEVDVLSGYGVRNPLRPQRTGRGNGWVIKSGYGKAGRCGHAGRAKVRGTDQKPCGKPRPL